MDGLTQSQRREVVGLILSLTSSVTISPGDLSQLRERVSALESANASLNESVSNVLSELASLSLRMERLTTTVTGVEAELASMTNNIRDLTTSLDTLSNTVTTLSNEVGDHTSTLSDLRRDISNMSTDVSNLKSSVSVQELKISGLDQRVATLEASTGSSLTFSAPLRLDGANVSMELDPYFCSVNRNLTSYSAAAQLMQFKWLVQGENGSSDSFDMDVNAHCHGQRTDYMMSTAQSLTVTGNSVTLVFDLDRLITFPPDLSRLIPCHGFQQATFPVELSFMREDVTRSYQVYGVYTTARVFRVTFSPGASGPAILRFLTVRTGIDT
uniref:Sigma c capsid protein n=1 Tax=Avian orthoreovirus TaxID=38170 RepID=A0A8D5PUF7_9REOV|nr:sigma c capsid protein [Avian orthoreovirus]